MNKDRIKKIKYIEKAKKKAKNVKKLKIKNADGNDQAVFVHKQRWWLFLRDSLSSVPLL
jgi:hypothetical protein